MISLLLVCLSLLPQNPATPTVEEAVAEVQRAIENGADDLDLSRAVIKLAVIDNPAAAKELVKLLPHIQNGGRYTAVTALEHCQNDWGFKELRDLALNSKFNLDRRGAISVLVKTHEGREWLAQRFKQIISFEGKVMLLKSLEAGKRQERLILNNYKEKTPAFQGAAIHSAARVGLTQTRSTAFACLDDSSQDVKIGAVYACGLWGGVKGVKKMAQMALKANNPLLQASLWHSLRLANDADEVEELAKAMVKARKPEDKAFLAKALTIAGLNQPEIAGDAFAKLLRASDKELRLLALRGIATTAHEASLTSVIKLMKARDSSVRAEATRALSAFSSISEKHAERVIELCRDKDPGVRVSATMALQLLPEKTALEALKQQLQDQWWPVQDVAVEQLAEMRSLPATRALAEHMKRADGLVLDLTYQHLKRLTGQDFSMTKSAWSRWMADLADNYELPSPQQAEQMLKELEAKRAKSDDGTGVANYHDIPVQSGGVVFIFDVSRSMGQKYTSTAEVFLDHFAQELANTILGLNASHKLNVILFSDTAISWQPAVIQVTEEVKAEAAEFILKQRTIGSTQLQLAIETAFDDPDVQQIYIMTDGDPAGGLQGKTQILDRVTELNRHRRVRIHTIIAGDVHGDFLKELAFLNGGTSVDLRD